MTRHSIALTIIASLCTQPAQAQRLHDVPVHIGLVYPLSSNGLQAPTCDNAFSFQAIGGVSRSEHGLALAGVTNVITGRASGLQLAGFSNHIGGPARGMQLAGFANTTGGDAAGLQLAGFANITRSMRGMQLAGFANIAQRHTSAQVAGFLNISRRASFQLAGFANTARHVKGTQVAGFLNVARKVDGAQVAGFLNIADSSACPIGIINLIKDGEKAIGTTLDETMTQLAAFRSGGRCLYGILGAGINLKEDNTLYALETGIGYHMPVTKQFRINLEGSVLTLTDFRHGSYLRTALRLLPAFRLGPVEVFAGPSFNCVTLSRNTGQDLVRDYTWQRRSRYGSFTGLYFGGLAGIQCYF